MKKYQEQPFDDELKELDEEIKKLNKELYTHLLQPPRRIKTGELIENAELNAETRAFIKKKKAELNVDDWPPKYRGWVPSDALVEEYMQFCLNWKPENNIDEE